MNRYEKPTVIPRPTNLVVLARRFWSKGTKMICNICSLNRFRLVGDSMLGGGGLAPGSLLPDRSGACGNQKNVPTYGPSRWASVKEIARVKFFEPASVFLGTFKNCYLRHNRAEYVMAFAPTRSGKSAWLVVPTLLSWPHSAVIHGIKGETGRSPLAGEFPREVFGSFLVHFSVCLGAISVDASRQSQHLNICSI